MSLAFLYDDINYFISGGIELQTELLSYEFDPTPDIYRMRALNFSVLYQLPVVTLTVSSAVASTLQLEDILYTAVASGVSGDSISITYLNTKLDGSAEVTSATGGAIIVEMQDGVTDADTIAAEINTNVLSNVLVSAAVDAGQGADPQGEHTATFLTGGSDGGAVNGFEIISGGSGNNNLGLTVVGSGSGAILTPDVDESGKLVDITITDGGSGYSAPTVAPTSDRPEIVITTQVSDDAVTWEDLNDYTITTTPQSFYDLVEDSKKYYRVTYPGGIKASFRILSLRAYTTEDVVTQSKLIPFVFNNEQKYLLVLRDEAIFIYQDDVLIHSMLAPGLSAEYFARLKFTQAEDTMIFTHPEMRTKQLQRTETGWIFSDFPWTFVPYALFGAETITNPAFTLTPSATEGNVKLTASGGTTFSTGSVGQYIDGGGGRVRITEYVSATVVQGYTIIPFYSTTAIGSGKWKYITGYEEAWSDLRGYPTTCMFYQQRLWFGGSKSKPNTIWASRVGQYDSFENVANYDNDAIDATISSAQIDEIVNIYANRGVQLFTAGAEWVVPEGATTPDTIFFVKNTSNGSLANVNPVDIAGVTMFVEKNGKSLLSFAYTNTQAAFTTDSLSLLTDMILDPVSMAVDYNSSKDTGNFLYIVLADGTMAVACILLDQQVNSFVRWEADGIIQDVANVAGDTYILVDRDKEVILEKLADHWTDMTLEFAPAQILEGLTEFEGFTFHAYTDTEDYGNYTVLDGQIDLGFVPAETVYLGIDFAFQLISNKIAVNGQTENIEKRIGKATVATHDTERLTFCGQTLRQTDNVYDIYGATGFSRDCRYTISGMFWPVEVLSVVANINYGAK